MNIVYNDDFESALKLAKYHKEFSSEDKYYNDVKCKRNKNYEDNKNKLIEKI